MDWPFPLWIAHRGAGKLAPENTLAAFRHGAALGWRAFEFDVKLSADGVPFLLHDTELERTTNGTGKGGELSWRELSILDAGSWHSAPFAGEAPPTLQAVLRWGMANGHALNIEIKPTPGLEQATGLAVGEICARLWQHTATPLLFSSFQPEALQGAASSAPHLARALLLETLWDGWLPAAQRLGCVAVITNHALMDAALMATLQAHQLRGMCYTVNEAGEAQRLLTLGVHGIITDAVDRFKADAAAPSNAGLRLAG